MTHITLNDALAEYHTIKLPNLKVNTRRAHEGQLEAFRVWVAREVQANTYLDDIDHVMMARYFARLRPPKFQESTFNNYRQYLKAFWQYCVDRGWVRLSPMIFIAPLKVPEKQRLRLSATELTRALDLAPNARDRAFLATGMNTLLRAQDLAILKVGDADFRTGKNGILNAFNTKTGRRDELHMTEEFRAELLAWFEVYADMMHIPVSELSNTYTLLPPFQGKRKGNGERYADPKPFGRFVHPELIVQGVLTQMGFPTYQQGFHTLRRSSARVLHDNWVEMGIQNPIRIIQALLGHKQQAVTEIYLGLDVDRQRRDELMAGQPLLTQAAEREALVGTMSARPGTRAGTQLGERRARHA